MPLDPVHLSSVFPLAVIFVAWWFRDIIKPYSRFLWHCFIRPLGTGLEDQKSRLYQFYKGQAQYYDATRSSLLRGRETMLSLSAAHLKTLLATKPQKKLIWVDIGGGTGYNIEEMDKFFPIRSFDTVYLIDLCEPLLEVARTRFAKRGWTNVHVLCQDASSFTLSNGGLQRGSINLITMSYSLSMIPDFHAVVDRAKYALSRESGIMGVVDFYTAGKPSSPKAKDIGGANKECGWISRWFWQMWFEFDHIHVGPARRSYLEHKFGTVKTFNDRNMFAIPYLVQIPYYIWLGRSRTCDMSKQLQSFKLTNKILDSKHMVPASSAPMSSFYYSVGRPLRMPYYDQKVHKEFRTFIYSFTWEDPYVDMEYLNLTTSDEMLVITSAGDNALHYAIHGNPRKIHCVDMNPSQGHLLELKLACLQSPNMDHEAFFSLFGDGQFSSFHNLLDSSLSPYLSAACYRFWRSSDNVNSFTKGFYRHGYTGMALAFMRTLFWLTGVSGTVKEFCSATTAEEQSDIWERKLKDVLLNPVLCRFIFESNWICWNALGVPKNQLDMVLHEQEEEPGRNGSKMMQYVEDTFSSLPSKWIFNQKEGNYFYLLTLLGHYTRKSCPSYLTKEGFDVLRASNGKALDSFKLHTESIDNVLKALPENTLTKAIIMDHLDWFSQDCNLDEVESEIQLFYSRLKSGGEVYWRSAAKTPWYAQLFAKHGFRVERLAVREQGKAIDRVNMYASFWRATKV